MNYHFVTLTGYLGVGLAGGVAGHYLRVPSGALIGSMAAVIALKFITATTWSPPPSFGFIMQILLGVMIGAAFERQMLGNLARLAMPIAVSTLVLVATGLVLCLIFTRLGLMDIATGYLGTNPGAMTVLVFLSFENKADPAVVLTFHFVRVVFVVLTAPLIVRLLTAWK